MFITADTHFGHENIIRFCNRPYASVEEMDEALIKNWNDTVGENQVIYHLGDFAFRGKPVYDYVRRLNGKIHIIQGNHDNIHDLHSLKKDGYIESVSESLIIRHNKKKIFLSHYPHRSWPSSAHGTFHAYGHVHGTIPPYGRSMDVGVDSHNMFPIRLDDFLRKLENNGRVL